MESMYVHLNPVRVQGLGLDKKSRKAEGQGLKEADPRQVQERINLLRAYEWSSYRAYAGYTAKPEWLETGEILRRGGGREEYRRCAEKYVRYGKEEELSEQLKARLVIGAREFVENAKRLVKSVGGEQPDRALLVRRLGFEQIVKAVEKVSGEKWKDFAERYGDVWRDMVLYIARRQSGLTLSEIGIKAGGLDYKTVGKAVGRLAERLEKDIWLRRLHEKCTSTLSIVET